MIPIEDHKWHRLPSEELQLPDKHYAEYARTDDGGIVARIVGPRAHVLGEDPDLWIALGKAYMWFESVGCEL